MRSMHAFVTIRIVLAALAISVTSTGQAQNIEALDNGLKQLTQGPLTLITDLPIDEELKQWPEVLEQAIAQWNQVWPPPEGQGEDLHLTAFLIGDRARFQTLGILQGVPGFEDGYQQSDRVFLVEQPSVYYRRHLFLHEATHWIMYRRLGGAGSPWFMEGMADMYGTHLWSDGKLTLGVIPREPKQVPHWGRFKRLQEMIEIGNTPSLEQILNYGNESQDRMDRYVWSWAACVFFNHHPEYRQDLLLASQPPLDYSLSLSVRLRESLADRWPRVVADWNGFLTDFDFGFDPAQSMPQVGLIPMRVLDDTNRSFELEIDASQGWQSSGVQVSAGQEISVKAEGSFLVAQFSNGKAWRAEAQGITLRYFRHQPMGRLVAAIAPIDREPSTRIWEMQSIGRGETVRASQDGVLMLKINEPAGDLLDNQGSLRVQVRSANRPS
jgi:hypothetical protein